MKYRMLNDEFRRETGQLPMFKFNEQFSRKAKSDLWCFGQLPISPLLLHDPVENLRSLFNSIGLFPIQKSHNHKQHELHDLRLLTNDNTQIGHHKGHGNGNRDKYHCCHFYHGRRYADVINKAFFENPRKHVDIQRIFHRNHQSNNIG